MWERVKAGLIVANNYRFKVKIGEDKTLTFTILDADNVAVDLTDKDVYFTMTKSGTVYIDRVVCTPDANQVTNPGLATYALTSAVTATLTKGEYDGEFAVVDEMGLITFYPNDFTPERDYIKVVVSPSKAIPE
jgi:BppU N-terminal domain